MLLRLIRNQPIGFALTGTLYVDSQIDTETQYHRYALSMDTLEHLRYAIPDGFYRLRLTYSPTFKEILPLLDNVIGRTGIRIHAGNTIAHTEGCILVGDLGLPLPSLDGGSIDADVVLRASRKRLEALRTYLLTYQKQNPYEAIYIQLASPDPYPDYDLACNYERQQHIQESLRRAKEMRLAQQ